MAADSYADLLEHLFQEFESVLPLDTIERVVIGCRADLAGQVRPGAALELLGRLARERLTQLAAEKGPSAYSS